MNFTKKYLSYPYSSIHRNALLQQYGVVTNWDLFNVTRSSKNFVLRLENWCVLEGHTGCVNTISWNDSGSLLLSGSDDYMLNIYHVYSQKMLHSIQSGHHSNIFSAKFLPCTSDMKIVSCSGDGMLQYNELGSTYGGSFFNCHSGTTYEVVVTPGDPNTFLSCGEDGTVRLFDLRTKTKCHCQECSEDILIDTKHGVTSISINPLAPCYLAVGCKDSYVRLFDCRTLGTNVKTRSVNQNRGSMPGLFCKFKPENLRKDASCRITSVQYSESGSSVLVSYCADYIYSFSVNEGDGKYMDATVTSDGKGCHADGDKHDSDDLPPVKRLRLRGDWSDTGPQASPDTTVDNFPETNLMQRMSVLFSAWLEDVISSPLQRERSTASQSSDNEGGNVENNHDGEQNGSGPDITNAPSETYIGSAEGNYNENEERDITEGEEVQDVEEVQEINRGEEKEWLDEVEEGRRKGTQDEEGEGETEEARHVNEAKEVVMTGEVMVGDDVDGKVEEKEKEKEIEKEKEGQEEEGKKGEEDLIEQTAAAAVSFHDNICHCPTNKSDREINKHSQGTSEDVHDIGGASQDGEAIECIIQTSHVPNITTNGIEGDVPSIVDDNLVEGSEVCVETSTTADTSLARNLETLSDNRNASTTEAASDHVGEFEMTSDDSNEREKAAICIQKFLRRNRGKFISSEENDDAYLNPIFLPKAYSLFKGHRNARTMIKEANFWGEDYILSGSDCGRIFIWDRHTGELIMLLQGDRRVVNCVQPHPFDPILASSGIDHNVKIWAPTSQEPPDLSDMEEIIHRNEQMLEKNSDTIIVPASFVFRMLASFRSRRRSRQDDGDMDDMGNE